jgi:EAL domain-containing protein (putative c-di-GMP-specific phosphodiesterase class I)
MPIAEEGWLIGELGAYVLREACRQLARWQSDPATPAGIHMSVNLSGRQLTDPEIVSVVAAAVSDAGLESRKVCLEITETALLADPVAAADALAALRAMGVRLALDDFGTGYSSLSHLKRFPLDVIKLDRTFVAGIGGDSVDGRDEAIIRAVMGLAHSFSLTVVAEGVETVAQRDRLLELGCGVAQGYLFGRPAPAADWSAPAAASVARASRISGASAP